jgi:UDP-3-O-[3-hydroxymyristoyl] glucosamine N-acyltransferase
LVLGQTGVTKNIPAGAVIGGMSQDYQSWRRSQALFARLPELNQRLKRVERAVKQVEPEEEK